MSKIKGGGGTGPPGPSPRPPLSTAIVKLYRVAFFSDRIGFLFTHKNGDFGRISVTERSCATPISKTDLRISDRFSVVIKCSIAEQINEDLSFIASWCCHNHLLMNPNKTKLLVMGTRQMLQKLPDFYITLLGKEIAPVASARDLGVQVDATLSYNEHVTNTTSTCMASLCQINRIKHLLDSRTLENVITSLVFSKQYFCSTVWANTSKTNVRKLQKIQNFAARILTGQESTIT